MAYDAGAPPRPKREWGREVRVTLVSEGTQTPFAEATFRTCIHGWRSAPPFIQVEGEVFELLRIECGEDGSERPVYRGGLTVIEAELVRAPS